MIEVRPSGGPSFESGTPEIVREDENDVCFVISGFGRGAHAIWS